ncbi:MAG: ATPase [Candidatus Cloacimonetes bacterium HGW-Cloacimonetes-1]|jgi:ABC-type multidrug transport system ATPase subunit|nr:MAG: ATPase [Candidatus Cloacimonetes bacterium HGW-Cloacimonetes-1]
MNTINIEHLCYYYDKVQALDDVSLSVIEGEIHGLIGPDSAGKTTLMRILCGLMPTQEGKVSVLSLDSDDFMQIRSLIGYMPQRFSLYQDLSVAENLKFFARLFNVPAGERDKRMQDLYAFSHLEEFSGRRAGALSGGMKQKLALSCALIHRPRLLILDEPTYGVDPVSRQEFWQMLKQIQGDGTTILVSTPYMDEAELCDRVSLINGGKILESDTLTNIRSKWNRKVFSFSAPNLKQLFGVLEPLAESCQLFGNEIHIVIPNASAAQSLDIIKSRVEGIKYRYEEIESSMEDIFLSYMNPGVWRVS